MKYKAIFHSVMPILSKEFPRHRWVMLTLTVPNPPMSELRTTIGEMGRAWTRLTHRDCWPAHGWVKALEVTRGQDDRPHPHYHVLLMLPRAYFGEKYIKQERWLELWREVTRDPSITQVDIRIVKGDPNAAVPEVLKYETKMTDVVKMVDGQDPWLAGLHAQMHKIRSVAVGGAIKPFLKLLEQEQEDLIGADGDGVLSDSQEMSFVWGTEKSSYLLHEPEFAGGHSLSIGGCDNGRQFECEPGGDIGRGLPRNSAFGRASEICYPA